VKNNDIAKGETLIIKAEAERRKGTKTNSRGLSTRGHSRSDSQRLERDGEEISEGQVDFQEKYPSLNAAKAEGKRTAPGSRRRQEISQCKIG
jgi:hypothetical protein